MNKTTVLNKVDYFREAVNLLVRLNGTESYDELEKKLIRKLSGSKKSLSRKFVLLKKIEKEAKKRFAGKEEDIAFYFEHAYEEGKNFGELAILWSRLRFERQCTVKKAKKYIESFEEKEYCIAYAECIREYGTILDTSNEDFDVTQMDEQIKVVRMIMELDIPMDEKWKVQEIFLQPELHREKVFELITIAMEVLEKFREELDSYAKEFAGYWKKRLEDEDFFGMIEQGVGIKIDENPNNAMLEGSFIIPNTFQIITSAELDMPYDMRLGFAFDEEFQLKFDNPFDNPKKYYEEVVVDLLKLLSDNSKFQILLAIKDQKAYGSELAKKLGLTTATISHHMSALTSNGLVTIEKEDTRIFYKANTKKLGELLDYCSELLVGNRDDQED